MSLQSNNPSKGGSLGWAWKLLDRHRRRDRIDSNQVDHALAAIASVHGRSPIAGSPTFEFSDEVALRQKVAPR